MVFLRDFAFMLWICIDKQNGGPNQPVWGERNGTSIFLVRKLGGPVPSQNIVKSSCQRKQTFYSLQMARLLPFKKNGSVTLQHCVTMCFCIVKHQQTLSKHFGLNRVLWCVVCRFQCCRQTSTPLPAPYTSTPFGETNMAYVLFNKSNLQVLGKGWVGNQMSTLETKWTIITKGPQKSTRATRFASIQNWKEQRMTLECLFTVWKFTRAQTPSPTPFHGQPNNEIHQG